MIHIFIGTKAQYVKTAPVILELQARRIAFNLIDSGQHSHLSKSYRDFFGIKEPDAYLRKEGGDIKTVGSLLGWFFKFLFQIIFQPNYISKELFKNQKGICLIHGDTPTTLLSLLAAKRAGIKVAHLESGLRSYNIFHPFPEEIIRLITMRLSDYLFAPNQWSLDNLVKMNVQGEKILLDGNTNIDVLRIAQSKDYPLPNPLTENKKFVIFSIHRVETILNKSRLEMILRTVQKVALNYDVLFCLHPPTKKQLEKFDLIKRLQSTANVYLMDLLPYPQFIQSIKKAHFIVTDGGSVQEESFFLRIPCLLMRNKTERIEGLQENVFIAELREDKIQYFLEHVESFRKSSYKEEGKMPSRQIVEYVLRQSEKNI